MTAITVTHRLSASPERVFAAWLDPRMVEHWGVTRAQIDPRVGGRFRFETEFSTDEGTSTHVLHGKFFEIVPNEKLVMSWGDDGPDGDNDDPPMVTALFTPEPDGGVTLTVTEENFDPGVSENEAQQAWLVVFAALEKLLNKKAMN